MNILSIQVALPEIHIDTSGRIEKEWNTALFKETISEPTYARTLGLEGDGQADLENHGGVNKAICVYPSEHFPYWRSELDLDFKAGSLGENFTSAGVLESEVYIGDIYSLGDLIVQVSQPRQPCWKIARRWAVKKLALMVQETGKTGWYFRVLQEGQIQAPQILKLEDRPYPKWSVKKANELMHHEKDNWESAYELSQCPALSPNWQDTLSHRASTKQCHSESPRLTGDAGIG